MIGAALAIGQGLYGAYNAYKAGQEANSNQARLEKLAANSPLRKQSPELSEYYQQSLNRYNENPFTTPYYMETVKQGDRGVANALSAMQTRGAAVGSIGKINQILADTKNRGIAGAIQNKNAQFSQLGQATQMKKNEADQLFNTNQQAPYERMLQLQQLKTQAANDRYNAGLNMAAQGVSNATQYGIAKEMYNPTVKTDNSNVSNLVQSYKTPATTTNAAWGTNFNSNLANSNPSTFASANPLAWGTATGEFGKNPLVGRYSLPKNYNRFGF